MMPLCIHFSYSLVGEGVGSGRRSRVSGGETAMHKHMEIPSGRGRGGWVFKYVIRVHNSSRENQAFTGTTNQSNNKQQGINSNNTRL